MPTYPTYKLSEIARSTKGKKPKSVSKEKTDGFEIPYVDIKAFEKGIVDNYTDGENCTFCNPDDVLIVWDGARCGFVGRGVEGAIGSTLAKISSDKYTNDFLFYFLQSKYKMLNSNPRGVGIPHIEPNLLWNFEIPDVDKTTQHAIVTRIETLFAELDKAVQHLRTAQQQLKTYRQAVLNHWLNNEDGKWEMVKLGEVAEKIFDGPFGTHLKSDDYVSSGIRVVRLENIKAGYFDDSKQSFVTAEKYEIIKRHTVYPTDLIMSTFISEEVKVCQMPKHIDFAVNKADCIGIRLKPLANNDFIKYYLSLRSVYHQLEIQVHGATRPRVNTTQIKNIKIYLPPLIEQHRIVKEIESRLSQAEAAEASIAEALHKTEALRQSTLKKAFSGELV